MYEVIATEPSIWIATELCCGGEPFDYRAEKGGLSEDELCPAAAHLYDNSIAHRDLKSENVLLDGRYRVKVGGFRFYAQDPEARNLIKGVLQKDVSTRLTIPQNFERSWFTSPNLTYEIDEPLQPDSVRSSEGSIMSPGTSPFVSSLEVTFTPIIPDKTPDGPFEMPTGLHWNPSGATIWETSESSPSRTRMNRPETVHEEEPYIPSPPPLRQNSSASTKALPIYPSHPSTPASSMRDKETKGRKARSGSVSIVQRATTALEAAGLVWMKSSEAVREDKDREREKSKEIEWRLASGEEREAHTAATGPRSWRNHRL
ncbi:hypothetical protein DXG01_009293 [Tephrocybe rancida]|nr:hypothetical protein DXG01_009293 [Tephrocybe rancida]